MGRKNLDRYREADWREASQTVDQILRNRWPVIAECPVCDLRIEADVRRIAQVMGPDYSLWGAETACRRIGCIGRVHFILRPRGAIMEYVMTAKALP
ncbi:hypothetical protein [Brevundimonas sp. NIBR11]|uniref:hypothetical protein n=1 Tax=Brevundimonas sp. NIBR11 TaxID=3015999 RepID=UPI0022EFE7E0|nr:hypothetical protein [Brevundimonas sp. NIBR11]WGM31531.1 hypothetical protein KKHFBJBL_01778 [Brevundimonas sp. NIBR11]